MSATEDGGAPMGRLQQVCYPCYAGEHGMCRHRPNGPEYGRAPEGTPCQCEAGGHVMGRGTCGVGVQGGERGSWPRYNDRCDKPVKGTVTTHGRFSRGPIELEMCGVHLAAVRRVRQNDERRAAEGRARDEADERARQLTQASCDWARRLADEFGIPAEPHHGRTHDTALRVKVDPERLYGVLVDVVGLLRDAGIDDHPLQPAQAQP